MEVTPTDHYYAVLLKRYLLAFVVCLLADDISWGFISTLLDPEHDNSWHESYYSLTKFCSKFSLFDCSHHFFVACDNKYGSEFSWKPLLFTLCWYRSFHQNANYVPIQLQGIFNRSLTVRESERMVRKMPCTLTTRLVYMRVWMALSCSRTENVSLKSYPQG